MANSNELLDILIAQPNPEGHIVIGGDRVIRVPENLKRIGVEHDHDIETVTFDCPKVWDGQDLSTMVLYINYKLANGYKGSYPVDPDTIKPDGDIMHFDWTISRNVTQVKGTISFLVCAVKTETKNVDGEEVHDEVLHWNSELNQEMYISEGMQHEEPQIDEVSDIITAMFKRYKTEAELKALRDECAANLKTMTNLKTATESAHQQTAEAASEIRNSYANAIKGNFSGEIVRVDDVSPLEHDVKCWVHGKNQLSLDGTPSQQSTQSHTYRSWLVNPDRKTMTLSVVEKDNSVDISDIYFGFCENGRDGLDGVKWLIEAGTVKQQDGYVYSSLPYVSIYPATQETVNKLSARFDIQLEYGSVPTDYEPWIDPATVTVTRSNKNMFSYPFEGTNYGNGITFTDAGDGSIIVHGTNDGTSNSVFYVTKDSYLTIPAGTYCCSPNVAGLVLMGVEKGGGYFTLASENKKTFTLSEPKTFRSIYIQIGKGNTTTFHNKKIHIMLEYSSILSRFESPASITYTPSANGSCTIQSVSSTMTLFTDTPGVTVEVEYNRDTTKMFESYVLTPEAKTEIAGIVESDLVEVLSALNKYTETLTGGGV